jgi:hypothetical protein
VTKRRSNCLRIEMFNLKTLKEIHSKEQYSVRVSDRFARFWKFFDAGVDINSALETTRKSIKISAKESLRYYKLNKHVRNK